MCHVTGDLATVQEIKTKNKTKTDRTPSEISFNMKTDVF